MLLDVEGPQHTGALLCPEEKFSRLESQSETSRTCMENGLIPTNRKHLYVSAIAALRSALSALPSLPFHDISGLSELSMHIQVVEQSHINN